MNFFISSNLNNNNSEQACEFEHPYFIRDRKDLIVKISRTIQTSINKINSKDDKLFHLNNDINKNEIKEQWAFNLFERITFLENIVNNLSIEINNLKLNKQKQDKIINYLLYKSK